VTAESGGWVRGVRLGVDVGTVRVGVAISDPDGILATPLVTLPRDLSAAPTSATSTSTTSTTSTTLAPPGTSTTDRVPSDIAELMRLVEVHESVEVVVGLPVTLAGTEEMAATRARAYARLLGQAIAPVPVRLADERMSTAAATRRLSERGVRGGRRRAVVDQAAAVEILQGWLDAARRQRHA
jgi:putative Holliday junction resolvase